MIKIENVVLPSVEQWNAIIRGMRNPMNSWDKSDSYKTFISDDETMESADYQFFFGDDDLTLANRLACGGPVHAKYRRMIPVYIDITAPLYWWKEFDTYKVGTVANSCSTMHKIHSKEFDISDFSTEHLMPRSLDHILEIIDVLNDYRKLYISAEPTMFASNKALSDTKKELWWQMIQLLPSSYNQRRTVMLNYEVLRNIYISRRNHKLDEWIEFCKWIESLPYFCDIIIPDGVKSDD